MHAACGARMYMACVGHSRQGACFQHAQRAGSRRALWVAAGRHLSSVASMQVENVPEPVRAVPVMEQGVGALHAIDTELGLAFDEWDIQYYYSLFACVPCPALPCPVGAPGVRVNCSMFRSTSVFKVFVSFTTHAWRLYI